jgi:hypothetical protein
MGKRTASSSGYEVKITGFPGLKDGYSIDLLFYREELRENEMPRAG